MSWMQRLFETYEACAGKPGAEDLLPIAHTTQVAHVEITLDAKGEFRRAGVLGKDQGPTLIPCTEESAGRSGTRPVNHPLCDKLQYVAGDFTLFGGEVTGGYSGDPSEPHRLYLQSLRDWRDADPHPKLRAIARYVEHGRVVSDLVAAKVLPVDEQGHLSGWGESQEFPIFSVLGNNQIPSDAFVRWRVEGDDPAAGTWADRTLIESWVQHVDRSKQTRVICMATGQSRPASAQHPAKIRHAADKAKLISSNDSNGFTYRGRFVGAEESATVGFEVSQKAHNALRWLIERQGYRDGDQAVCCWAVQRGPIHHPIANSVDLLGFPPDDKDTQWAFTAQHFGEKLKQAVAGYGAGFEPTDDVVFMHLASATPGRMSIAFFRQLKGSEYLARIEHWHAALAWRQSFEKGLRFTGAPSPRDIAEAAYGRRLDSRLRAATVERLLPCIVDRAPLPRDLLLSVFHRATNRVGLERREWEKVLGIACSLIRGCGREKEYDMALEEDRTSRDYLYGRLLAIADNLEEFALSKMSERRETNAARYMQRFADRPASTWRLIYLALRPYQTKLRASAPGFLHAREQKLSEVMNHFDPKDFGSDEKLGPEFLLGYYCQRAALLNKNDRNEETDEERN